MRIDRLNLLDQYVQEKGSATIYEIADHFNISVNTARRDISSLISKGKFQKVYGGVSILENAAPSYAQRNTEHLEEKKQIGQLAATLADNNMVIFLDSGSTTPYTLEYLAQKENITVVTYSLSVLWEAAQYPSLRVIALGGLFNHKTASFSGAQALDELSHINIHMAFLAATSVSLQYGLSNYSYNEAEIKQQVAKYCSRVVLLADHSKFGHIAVKSFFPFEKLSGVVTDRCPPPEFMKVIQERKITLLYPGFSNRDDCLNDKFS